MNAPFVYGGAMIENMFLPLVPTLIAGNIVVKDNLPLHSLAVASLVPPRSGGLS
jgi:hypothetical protein